MEIGTYIPQPTMYFLFKLDIQCHYDLPAQIYYAWLPILFKIEIATYFTLISADWFATLYFKLDIQCHYTLPAQIYHVLLPLLFKIEIDAYLILIFSDWFATQDRKSVV